VKEVETILKKVKSTLVNNFRSNPWMDEKTRKAAIVKSKKIKGLIGFPSYIKNEVRGIQAEAKARRSTRSNFYPNATASDAMQYNFSMHFKFKEAF
jgi:predicted metalloendopeptidase